ncbi:MAG TPA: hypothetical protein VIO36_14820 [Anaerolineaceae bacterium]
MRPRNIIAGLLVSLVSIALAIGITYVVQSSNNVELTMQTPTANNDPGKPTGTPVPGIASIIIDGTILPTSAYNCTFPMETWLLFPGAWRIDSYRIGNRNYSRQEMTQAMGATGDNLWDRLLAQIFTTVLNQQNGADVTSVRAGFGEAISWIQRFPRGSSPTDGDIQQIENVISSLARFNAGGGALPKCQYDLSLATAVVQPSLPPGVVATLTFTPSPIVTRRVVMPTWTREPSHNDPPPTARPTNPPVPTSRPTDVPATPVVQPTVAPVDPTSAPLPTDPPPTDPPAQPPEPTVGSTPQPASTVGPTTAGPTATERKTKKPRKRSNGGLLLIDPDFLLIY